MGALGKPSLHEPPPIHGPQLQSRPIRRRGLRPGPFLGSSSPGTGPQSFFPSGRKDIPGCGCGDGAQESLPHPQAPSAEIKPAEEKEARRPPGPGPGLWGPSVSGLQTRSDSSLSSAPIDAADSGPRPLP